jgi:hypothetical protein
MYRKELITSQWTAHLGNKHFSRVSEGVTGREIAEVEDFGQSVSR